MANITKARDYAAGKNRTHTITFSVATSRFEWAAALISLWVTGGLYLDGWAHEHGRVDESFFTPWHAALYGGVFFLSLFLAVNLIINIIKGSSWKRALPAGYGLSFIGTLLFLAGGGLDLAWHAMFGFEANIEALLSPTHLFLATSGVLMSSGPIRSLLSNLRGRASGGWKEYGPAIFSMTQILATLTFFTQYIHPFSHVNAQTTSITGEVITFAGILFQTGVLMAAVLWLTRFHRLPFGALTVLVGLTNGLMTVFRDQYSLVPAAILAGLLADVLVQVLIPEQQDTYRFSLFTFSVPVILYALYFLTIAKTSWIAWTIHLWLGSIFMAGIMGLLVGFFFRTVKQSGENSRSSTAD